MSIPVRETVRVLLLNPSNELLLMCVENFDIGALDGKRNNRFWFTVGGGVEEGESITQAAIREIYEETGITKDKIDLGHIVWHGYVDLVLKGKQTRLHESYIVAQTKESNVFLCQPTDDEKKTVKKLKWFSFDAIKQCPDVIFPVILSEYLPEILSGNYPDEPIELYP